MLAAVVVGATVLAVGGGRVGAALGATGPPLDEAFSPRGQRALALWMGSAVAVGVVAPAVALAVGRADPVVRRALAPYLGVLAVQIGTETVLTRRLPAWTALVTGTSYTSFRLWQLRTARADLATGHGYPRAAVTAALTLWSANLGVLAASVRPLTRGAPRHGVGTAGSSVA